MSPMLEGLSGWNFGLKGEYSSYKRGYPDESKIQPIRQKVSFEEGYEGTVYGLRLEKMLPWNFYLATEAYRAHLDYGKTDVYLADDGGLCKWIGSGKVDHTSGKLLIGKRWDFGDHFFLMGELDYQTSKVNGSVKPSRTSNSCADEHSNPDTDPQSEYDLPRSGRAIGLLGGFKW